MRTSMDCDLCQHNGFELIARIDRHGKPLDTSICTNCGLVRHAVVPTEAELHEFYATTYRSEYNGERTPGTRRVMRAWRNGERICRQVAPLLPGGGRVLEVGAGIGCTVKVFEQAGFQSEGIDPGGEFLKFSRDQLHADVQVRNLYELPQQRQYDAVLLVHVIEHLRSPAAAINHIAGLLKPGGMLYVECPNLRAPFARRSRLFHTAHIFNFVPTTLQWMAEACGFRVRTRFGDEDDTNLQMLFQHTGERRLNVGPVNYRRTLTDLTRSNAVSYHLRWRYVADRIQKLATYAQEHLMSKNFVADLVDECNADAQENSDSAHMTSPRRLSRARAPSDVLVHRPASP